MSMDLRARKAGIGLQIQRKQEARYDEEEKLGVPGKIVTWIENIVGDDVKKMEKNSGWRDIQFWLRDGVVLCHLINKLLTGAGKSPVKFKKNAHTQFVALENINQFNNGAKVYGVPQGDLFDAIDLFEAQKGPFHNAIRCLNRLGVVANQNGVKPEYEVVTPTLDSDLVGMLD